MDLSSITVALGAIKAASDIGKAALELRDFNKVAPAIAAMNARLLEAQDSLFAHNAQLLDLQGKYFATTEELRKVNEAMVERGRYTLVDLGGGVVTYRVNLAPSPTTSGNEAPTEPEHYLCQPCFDDPAGMRKVVLAPFGRSGSLDCSHCGRRYLVPDDRAKENVVVG